MTVPTGPVVLIGPMAAGKSHLGRYVAKRYGMPFVDTDQVIVAQHGPISALFVERGEAEFRRIEADVVRTALAAPENANAVISLGGGAPMTASVAQLLVDHTVAYIEVDEATVRPRITGNSTRPILQPDPERRWREILDERRATYEQLAVIHLDGTGNRRVNAVAEDLMAALKHLERDSTS